MANVVLLLLPLLAPITQTAQVGGQMPGREAVPAAAPECCESPAVELEVLLRSRLSVLEAGLRSGCLIEVAPEHEAMVRPLIPVPSDTTPDSFMFASSSIFWIPWTCPPAPAPATSGSGSGPGAPGLAAEGGA